MVRGASGDEWRNSFGSKSTISLRLQCWKGPTKRPFLKRKESRLIKKSKMNCQKKFWCIVTDTNAKPPKHTHHPRMNELRTFVVTIFALFYLVLALALALLFYTFSESRPDRDLPIRGSQEVKLSVSSERCSQVANNRQQWGAWPSGQLCVDANGKKLWNYNNNKNNNIYYLQLCRHPIAGVILHIILHMHGLWRLIT